MALIDVVKWDDPKDLLAWRYPNTELSTMTRVVVNESHQALLFKGGKLVETLGPGDHTLSTENIPLLSKIVNLPFGGTSPFQAEVWFVNRAVSLDVNWGTSDPIQVEDPRVIGSSVTATFSECAVAAVLYVHVQALPWALQKAGPGLDRVRCADVADLKRGFMRVAGHGHPRRHRDASPEQ